MMGRQERDMIVWLANADTSTWFLLTRLCQMEQDELNDIWTLTTNASCIINESPEAKEKRIFTELNLCNKLAKRYGMQLVSSCSLSSMVKKVNELKELKKRIENESKSKN